VEGEASILGKLGLSPGAYVLATVHRPANTDETDKLSSILKALGELPEPVVLPAHPRTQKAAAGADLAIPPNVWVVEPVGYCDMLVLEKHARCVVTDSGGVQKEAYLLGVPCVTLREETEWPETLTGGWNVLAGADAARIVGAARRPSPQGRPAPCFGDGRAAEKIVKVLENDPSQR
jgi:UDP-GlcNAc3NAcA epimerase